MDSGLYAVGCCVAHEVFVVPCSRGSWAICRRLLSVSLLYSDSLRKGVSVWLWPG